MHSAWKFLYWPFIWVASLGVPYAEMHGALRMMGGSMGLSLRITGLIILLYAMIMLSLAGRTLRLKGHKRPRSFWPDQLVSTGIYSCMRHPQHMGLSLVPLGIALLLASPIALLSAGWSVAASLAFVLIVEEPECIARFKDQYYRYMEHTPPFSINPQCLFKGVWELRRLKRRQA